MVEVQKRVLRQALSNRERAKLKLVCKGEIEIILFSVNFRLIEIIFLINFKLIYYYKSFSNFLIKLSSFGGDVEFKFI